MVRLHNVLNNPTEMSDHLPGEAHALRLAALNAKAENVVRVRGFISAPIWFQSGTYFLIGTECKITDSGSQGGTFL